DKVPSISQYAQDLSSKMAGNGGKLWFIGAGNTFDHQYSRNLERLRWSEIFEKYQGERLLRNLRNQICVEFGNPDFVFIDSRTGLTETSGVCTRYLADTVVVLTSLTDQNI